MKQLWMPLRDWLDAIPVADAVTRRNARAMQLLLLFIAVMLPVNWLYHLFIVGMKAWPGREILLGADLCTAAAAVVGFLGIRRGKVRGGVGFFLTVSVLGLVAGFATLGFAMGMYDQSGIVLALVTGGLVLGRRALWGISGLLLLAFFAGMLADARHLEALERPVGSAFANGPSVVLSYLVIVTIIDRCVSALRESLAESEARGMQLRAQMAERERMQAQLVHALKMEAVGRVASGVAHDFDNVLGVILGYAGQRERLADKGSQALLDALEGVELAGRRASAISRKLLTFSRADACTPEAFDLGDALDALQPMLRQLLGSRIRLSFEHPARPLPVFLDRGQFELIVLNIAANARDAMPLGGTFAMATLDGQASGAATVVLRDDGCGMNEATRVRVFEPFFTTKPPGSGTGLGLGVVNDLVRGAGSGKRGQRARRRHHLHAEPAVARARRLAASAPARRRTGNPRRAR